MYAIASIERALEFIEGRLSSPFSVEDVARAVGMSRWHFQRTFSAMVGEPVGSYLRRRRLSEAAQILQATDRTILDVALEFQFESHEVFTRAFKAELALTPSVWRRRWSGAVCGLPRIRISAQTLLQRFPHLTMTPDIVTLPALAFVGMEARFTVALSPKANNHQVIPQLWDRFCPRMGEIASNEPNAAYGLCDRPDVLEPGELGPDEALYLAALQVEPGTPAPSGMVTWRSPAATYAKFTHRGSVAKIGETMAYIYGRWLPTGDYTRGEGPDVERMDERFDPKGGAGSVLEIFIPVTKR